MCMRKGRVLAPREDNHCTNEKEALARARWREKCCWNLRGGVSQKPSHLTTCEGWKIRPPSVIRARERGELCWLEVRH